MGILLFLVFGLVIGCVAHVMLLGDLAMPVRVTTGLGVAGSFLGGCVVALVTNHSVIGVHAAGAVGSLVGALIVPLIAGGYFDRAVHA